MFRNPPSLTLPTRGEGMIIYNSPPLVGGARGGGDLRGREEVLKNKGTVLLREPSPGF